MMIMGNPKKVASMIIAKKLGGGGEDRAAQLRGESLEALESMNGEQDEGIVALQEAAGKLISAVESKSVELLAKAFQQMFRVVELMPHDEYDEEIEEAVEGPESGG